MRTIVLLDDNCPGATNVRMLSLKIAQKVKADLLILNFWKANKATPYVNKQLAAKGIKAEQTEAFDLTSFLIDSIAADSFRPVINEIDACNYTEKAISELVIKKNIWLIVKGIETHKTREIPPGVDVQAIINHVACPLLLVPDTFTAGNFENITYALDMRYCRMAVVRFLVELARGYGANLVIQHFSAKGLPHLNDSYARELFETEISNKIKYDKIYFNNIKERNLGIAVDVMVNDLHSDLLALVNHRYHFEELFGRSIKDALPEHVSMPVIIFPL